MARYSPNENLLSRLESKYKIPRELLTAVMQTESGGDINAVSPVGARGLMQFMPATAKQYGVNTSDPVSSLTGAAKMLSELNNKYQGDIPKVAAAYNWGQGNVDRRGLENAPQETRSYIDKIMGALNPIGEANASEVPYGQEPQPEAPLMSRAEWKAQKQAQAGQPAQATPFMSRAEWKAQKQAQPDGQYHGRNVEDMGAVSQFLTGTGNKVIDLARGAAQLTGLADEQGGGFGSQKDIEESRQLSEALGKTGAGTAGNIAGDVLPFMMTGGGATIPALAAKSAAMAGLEPTKKGESRLENIGMGAASGVAGGLLGKGVARAVKGFTPSAAAKDLMKQGIQPTVGQGIEQGVLGKAIRKAEEATTSMPLLGATTQHARSRALKEGVTTAIKQAEDKTLGVSAKGAVGHEAINNLKDTFNAAYTKAMEGHTLPLSPALTQSIVSKVTDPARFVNEPERKAIFSGLQGLFDKIRPQSNGQYLASDIHAIESELKAQARGLPFGDAKAKILNDVQKEIAKYRTSSLPPAVGETIKKLDAKYLNFTRLRRASEGVGAEHGEFSPAQLYNAATMLGKKSGQAATGSAPMQKLAGQMKSVLSDKLGESGTAPRMITNKMLVGGAGEAATAGFSLPAYSLLGAGMLAGSTRPVQKALLGGYAAQNKLSKLLGKSSQPAAAIISAKMRKRKNVR